MPPARYLGFGSVVGVIYLATGGSTPVHMSYEDGGTGPGGDRYSGLDSFGRVVETLWKMGSVVKQNASYGYDRSSNRQWRRDDLAHDLGGAEATRHDNFYWYDGLYQVKERKLGNLIGTAPAYTGIDNLQQTEDWCYDVTGNWQRYGNADESLLQARTHNAANEITAVTNPSGVIQPAYDKVGNQTADIAPGDWDRQFDLTWDAWNRLIQVKHSSTVIQTNAYDGLSRRITSSDGTDTIHYYYDPSWRAVEEYRNSDTAPERRYLWDLRSRWDLVKRERDDTGSLDEKRYVLYDAIDPVAICNASGTVTQRFEYSPFGETSFMDANFAPDASSGDWNWLFHGEFRDHDTGYYNYGYRFYNSTTGRWPSRDPIGEREGINLYGFLQNNGMSRIDTFGLAVTIGNNGQVLTTNLAWSRKSEKFISHLDCDRGENCYCSFEAEIYWNEASNGIVKFYSGIGFKVLKKEGIGCIADILTSAGSIVGFAGSNENRLDTANFNAAVALANEMVRAGLFPGFKNAFSAAAEQLELPIASVDWIDGFPDSASGASISGIYSSFKVNLSHPIKCDQNSDLWVTNVEKQ